MVDINKLSCILCNEIAATTAAGIPVCGEHHKQYQEEGKQYLPLSERKFYLRLRHAFNDHLTGCFEW
jgi:hypothetical protein